MKRFLILVILLSVANAAVIGPHIYEQKNFGELSLPEFIYSLSVDCTAATVNTLIMDANWTRVGGATSYLRYIDYSSPLLSQNQSDDNGLVVHKLPGSTTLMRGLFIMVLEKKGYRNKEIHFDIAGCLTNQSWVPPPPKPPPAKPPQQNNSGTNQSNQSTSNGTSQTQNNQTPGNQTSGPQNPTPQKGFDTSGIIWPALGGLAAGIAVLLALMALWNRGKRHRLKPEPGKKTA